jgi:hypothetical protein
VADVVVIGGPERLSRPLVAELAARGERTVHLSDSSDRLVLGSAHAVISLAVDAARMRALVGLLGELPITRRPLVLVDVSGDAACQAEALAARQLGPRVVLLDEATDMTTAETVGLIVHALRAWDLTGSVDAVAAQRSGYLPHVTRARSLVGAAR